MIVAERVQASIRAVNAADRDSVPAGPCTLYRHRTSDHPYLNYAVPEAGATRWDEIDDLRRAFGSRGLRPRLEFVAECAPGLEEALAAGGFALEARIPVMTCPAGGLVDVLAPTGVTIAPVGSAADVRAYLEVGAEAFGEPPPSDEQVERSNPPVRGLLARIDGVPAGTGSRSAIAEGVSEITGIGVRERFRRRGIAAAITAAAAAAAFADGAELCFLTPGDEGAERVYTRAGFVRAGTTMVHMVG
jgi:ribosomal protein S18 acetylase RimI-like enzyme